MSEYTDRVCGIGLPEDEKMPFVPKDKINITIAIFFDGTRNNKYNIERANSPAVPPTYVNLEPAAANNDKTVAKRDNTYVDKRHNAIKIMPKVPKKDNDSYLDTFSNVAELFEVYAENQAKNIGKVYVEGIGTAEPIKDENDKFVSSGIGDSQDGFAFGKGDEGINGKIERGCKLIVDEINKMKVDGGNNKATISTLTLDVFGFSRGAAAARSFVHRIEKEPENGITDGDAALQLSLCGGDPTVTARVLEDRKKMISEGKKVNLRKYLADRHIKIEEIKVRFLGVFDTVSSFAPGSFADLDFSNDVRELGLTVPDNVSKTVHLVAADEYRKNFALTTIKPVGQKVTELILPGAHSDIGGGYRKMQQEKIVMVSAYYNHNKEVCRGYMTFDELKNGRWLPPGSERQELDKFGRGHTVRTIKNRVVHNSYAKIPLELMGEFAKKEKLILSAKKYDDVKKLPDDHRRDLNMIRALIMGMLSSETNKLYQFGTETFGLFRKKRTIVQPICGETELNIIKGVRSKYIHLSAWNDKAAWGLVEPYEPAEDRKRRIYPG